MILDWSTSEYTSDTPSSVKVQEEYRDYHAIFPIGIQRYIELFDRIVKECWDIIVFEKNVGISLPLITLRPIHAPGPMSPYGPVTVKRYSGKKPLHVEIELSDSLVTALRTKLKIPQGPLRYIMLSDTETRTLRIFFPRPDIIPRIVHLGFYHIDIPGALYSILAPLARAKFNILTCLLRQNKDGRNVLEAVLEFRDSDEIPTQLNEQPSPEADERLCNWMAQKIRAHLLLEEVEGIKECELKIGLPRYPYRKNSWEDRVSFNVLLEQTPDELVGTSVRRELSEKRVEARQPSNIEEPEMARLYSLVERRREHTKPSIFLSYPHGLKDHARLVRKALEDRFLIVEYQEPDSEVILEQVKNKIKNCDYFIGIWHHDDDAGLRISEWLTFEYGVALAYDKKAIIVHSQKLDKTIWNRISPGIAQPEYIDVKFESVTVPMIVQYCQQHFIEEQLPLPVMQAKNF
jgi:hypothetical protein